LDLIPGLGRSPGEGKGYPFQYSGLENSMDSPEVRDQDWSREHRQVSVAGSVGVKRD